MLSKWSVNCGLKGSGTKDNSVWLCSCCHLHRYFTVKQAYEEGLVDKLVPGYKMNRFRKIAKDKYGAGETFFNKDKPMFRFKREDSKE